MEKIIEFKIKDNVIAEVCQDLVQRSNYGLNKYGVSLERTDVNLEGWLQHAYEECLDQANYLKRTILEIKRIKSGKNNISP